MIPHHHLLRYLKLKPPCSALECGARCRCSCLKSLKYLSVVWSWVQWLAHKNTMRFFFVFFADTCKICNDWQVSAKKMSQIKKEKSEKKPTIKLLESKAFWLTLNEWRWSNQKTLVNVCEQVIHHFFWLKSPEQHTCSHHFASKANNSHFVLTARSLKRVWKVAGADGKVAKFFSLQCTNNGKPWAGKIRSVGLLVTDGCLVQTPSSSGLPLQILSKYFPAAIQKPSI